MQLTNTIDSVREMGMVSPWRERLYRALTIVRRRGRAVRCGPFLKARMCSRLLSLMVQWAR